MSACNRCEAEEAQMQLFIPGSGVEHVGLNCYGEAMNGRRRAEPSAPLTQATPGPYKTQAEASARAAKLRFYLGHEPTVFGDCTLSFDSPLVPGFKGENPYK